VAQPEGLGKLLANLLKDLNGCGVGNVQQLIPIIDKWSKEVEEESKQLYADVIVLGNRHANKQQPGTYVSWEHSERQPYLQWAHGKRHFFNPVGLIRECLRKEFHKELLATDRATE
jgi:hypothetical protein